MYFQLAFLAHSLESYKSPKEHSETPILEYDLDLNLLGFKPTDFISPVTYSAPSTSHQLEYLYSLYSNPLFEPREGEEEVQKLVIRTPLRSQRRSLIPFHSPPRSPPHSSPPSSPSSPTNSTSSSSTTNTHYSKSKSSSMAGFRPIVQEIYAPLLLPNLLNDFPLGYLQHLPRFNGETSLSAEDHLATFLDFADNMNIEH